MKRSLYTYVDVVRSRRIHRRHGHARRARLSVGVRQTAIDVHLRPTSRHRRLHTHARRHHHTRRTMTSQRSRDARSLGAGARTVPIHARGRRRRRRLRHSVGHRVRLAAVSISPAPGLRRPVPIHPVYISHGSVPRPPTDRRDAPLWLLIRPGFAVVVVVVVAAKSFPRRPPWNRATTTATRRP